MAYCGQGATAGPGVDKTIILGLNVHGMPRSLGCRGSLFGYSLVCPLLGKLLGVLKGNDLAWPVCCFAGLRQMSAVAASGCIRGSPGVCHRLLKPYTGLAESFWR